MNILYQFPPALGLPNASPFCLKLELFLRMAEIPYEVQFSRSLKKSPTGKFPCLQLSSGKILPDSDLVIRHYVEGQAHALDAWLTSEQKAQAHAISRMLNEHLYWTIVYSRWIDEDGWQQLLPLFFKPLPALLRPLIGGMIRKKVRRDLYAQGVGRHDKETIYKLGMADLEAFSILLGDKPYLMGDRPCSVDASGVGHIANVVLADFDSPLKKAAARFPNLERYCRCLLAENFERFNSVPE